MILMGNSIPTDLNRKRPADLQNGTSDLTRNLLGLPLAHQGQPSPPSPILARMHDASWLLSVDALRTPRPKRKAMLITSVWNFAGAKSLVIVSANTPTSPGQRIDIEILDGSDKGNVYLSKRDIKGETRLAITTHESADVGVCVRNYLEGEFVVLDTSRCRGGSRYGGDWIASG